jgi:hypothetical protein
MDTLSGSHITPQNRIPNRGPKSGSQIGVLYPPQKKLGSQIKVPNRGPKLGSQIRANPPQLILTAVVCYIIQQMRTKYGSQSNSITCILRCR